MTCTAAHMSQDEKAVQRKSQSIKVEIQPETHRLAAQHATTELTGSHIKQEVSRVIKHLMIETAVQHKFNQLTNIFDISISQYIFHDNMTVW